MERPPPRELTRSLPRRRRSVPDSAAPSLFVVLDADRPLAGGMRLGLGEATSVHIGRDGERGVHRRPGGEVLLRLSDPHLSVDHARLALLDGGWTVEDLRSKNGTRLNGDALEAPRALEDGDLLQVGCTFLRFRKALPGTRDVPDRTELDLGDPSALTLQPGWEAELARLDAVARSAVPVLLQGESGSGKELLAARVHAVSGRPGALVAVNCAGLSDGLVNAELFGHRKGAFSGAIADAPGLVRSADRGTLFLDEIGDMAPRAQAAILRVLQEREVLPVGGARPVPVEFRLVAATHRNLGEAVAAGTFRADLLSRLSGFVLTLPPLRERQEDTGVLIGAVLARLGPKGREVRFEPEAALALLEHDWPLNVRELQQAVEAALALAPGRAVSLQDLPAAVSGLEAVGARENSPASDASLRTELEALLRVHRGNVSAVARALGMARPHLHRVLKRQGLSASRHRP